MNPSVRPAAANGRMDMRGVPLHVYYIQFGQHTHPMGSGRPPWAAGKLFMAKAGSKVEEDKKIFRIRECVNPDPMPVSVSVYTGHTLQCILCTQCSISVPQCTLAVYVQYTLATLSLGLGIKKLRSPE